MFENAKNIYPSKVGKYTCMLSDIVVSKIIILTYKLTFYIRKFYTIILYTVLRT